MKRLTAAAICVLIGACVKADSEFKMFADQLVKLNAALVANETRAGRDVGDKSGDEITASGDVIKDISGEILTRNIGYSIVMIAGSFSLYLLFHRWPFFRNVTERMKGKQCKNLLRS